ncbi:putative PPC domain-containing protein [Rosa chinensis]|uniref:AT-hook motif nuclear-localized protein n=1 Tax=Rosa chinensis TaxID=74649 RepID=A0A2P6P7U4_ROSCH|nr:AT-hook motif nuclear-localized protein 1 [Rosa chinensis]PRQ17998.1 putative PPC domain-containing protein [Rosa chinensis]
MEGREAVNTSGVTVVGSDAPSDYHVAPRAENPANNAGSAPAPPVAPPPGAAMPAGAGSVAVKKKRGRPRKYGPDGSVTMALSPKPISSAAPPPVIDFAAEKQPRGKVKPASSVSKNKYEMENLGEWVACSVGANFTPHIINVNSGEDVMMKIISFSQQGPRAICVLSANGVISSVTLRQPDSSGGTLTYEGRFEILSLSGSFMPNESGGTRSRSGGMSVSLASPDGRVVGGGVAGLLVAASPVQVVVGSFLAGNQHEQKPKKQKHEYISNATPTMAIPVSSAEPKTNLSSSTSFRGDNWSSYQSDHKNKTDINVSLPGGVM